MKKYATLSVLVLSSFFYTYGQYLEAVDITGTPYDIQDLINSFQENSNGIEVINYNYQGDLRSAGIFQKGTDAIGMEQGIVFSTGRVVSEGSNYGIDQPGISFASTSMDSSVTDIDLETLAASTINDAVVLTIDFIPTGDMVSFKYIFASEEYPEWACSAFNDVFGLFVSGPGINGAFDNGAENIALIPGTDIPVAINNIHPQNGVACPAAFEQYYNDNNGSMNRPVYDGFLDVFTASIATIPCETYTLKIALCDVGDDIFDSAIFLEAESLLSNHYEIIPSFDQPTAPLVEGCSTEAISFDLSGLDPVHFPVTYTFSGDAILGMDYTIPPLTGIVDASDPSLNLNFEILQDSITEGFERFSLTFQSACLIEETFQFMILDELEYDLPTQVTNCQGIPIELGVAANVQNFNFSFTNSDMTDLVDRGLTISQLQINDLPYSTYDQIDMIESVCLNVLHKWLDDLDVYLRSPSGAILSLSSDNGANCNDFVNTCFVPEFADPINSLPFFTCAPTDPSPYANMNYLPEGNWEQLRGSPLNGTWELVIYDDAQGFVGTLIDWTITFSDKYHTSFDYLWSNGATTNSITVEPLASTTYYVTIENGLSSCVDSVFVEINGQGAYTEIIASFCEDDFMPIEVNGTIYDQQNPTGTEVFEGVLGNGCDSVVFIDLSFVASSDTLIYGSMFEGQTFIIANQAFDEAGFYTIALLDQFGCDSIVYLSLLVLDEPNISNFDTVIVENCDSLVDYCFGFPPEYLATNELIINGEIYAEPISFCGADSTYVINTAAIPGSGSVGEYEVTEWIIGGDTINFFFEGIVALIDSMNHYDPGANWEYFPDNNIISAVNPGNHYTHMNIVQLSTGATVLLGFNVTIYPTHSILELGPGNNEILINNVGTGLSDTFNITVIYPGSTSFFDIEMYVGETLLQNINTVPECGDFINAVLNACPSLSGDAVEVGLDVISPGVTYNAISEGIDTACIVYCSNLGNCDTIIVEITVLDTTNAVNELQAFHNIKVFPNPGMDQIFIENLDFKMLGQITLLDASGRKVMEDFQEVSKIDYDLTYLAEGIYFIQIQNAQGIFYEKLCLLR